MILREDRCGRQVAYGDTERPARIYIGDSVGDNTEYAFNKGVQGLD